MSAIMIKKINMIMKMIIVMIMMIMKMIIVMIITTSLSGLAVAQLVKEAGFPPGVVNVVPGFVTNNVMIFIIISIIIIIVVMIIITSS